MMYLLMWLVSKMFEINSIIKRNIKIFLRDPLAIFFSFLSTIILLMIYIVFLGDVTGGSLDEFLTQSELSFLVYTQMMGGVIVLNTMTIPLGNLGNIVTDFEYNIIDSFVVTPVKRYKIILGYYFASLIITLILSFIVWIIAALVIGFVTGIFIKAAIFIKISLLIALFVFISTSFMILLATLVKSVNAFGAVSGIFGSFIGFVSGIYMPISSSSPAFLRGIASIFPFTHMTSLSKNILMEQTFETLRNKGEDYEVLIANIKDNFGAGNVGLLGFDLSVEVLIGLSITASVIALLLATKILNRRIKA